MSEEHLVMSHKIAQKLCNTVTVEKFYNECQYFYIEDSRFIDAPNHTKLIPRKLLSVYTMKGKPGECHITPAPMMAEIMLFLGELHPKATYSFACDFDSANKKFKCVYKPYAFTEPIIGSDDNKCVDAFADVLIQVIEKEFQKELSPASI